jgi:hypothetical protein
MKVAAELERSRPPLPPLTHQELQVSVDFLLFSAWPLRPKECDHSLFAAAKVLNVSRYGATTSRTSRHLLWVLPPHVQQLFRTEEDASMQGHWQEQALDPRPSDHQPLHLDFNLSLGAQVSEASDRRSQDRMRRCKGASSATRAAAPVHAVGDAPAGPATVGLLRQLACGNPTVLSPPSHLVED